MNVEEAAERAMLEEALPPPPEHTVHRFTSSVGGDGFDVDVQIVVAGNDVGPDVYEVGEHAAQAASRVASLGRGRPDARNVAPFTPPETPPF